MFYLSMSNNVEQNGKSRFSSKHLDKAHVVNSYVQNIFLWTQCECVLLNSLPTFPDDGDDPQIKAL